ncbi:MAG: hypothetical protein R3257_02180, partial [bacterium]|nr:hypothetical protein [bacterium]
MLPKLSQIVGSESTLAPEGRSASAQIPGFLRDESNPELLMGDLFELGRELEQSGRFFEASQIYQGILQGLPMGSPWLERAEERLRILNGQGPTGLQLEHYAHGFLDQVTDPAMLVGMGIGGLAFRGGRLLTLNGLVGSGRAGLGVRTLATLGGLTTETLAFTSSAKGIHSLMGHGEDWSSEALLQEWGATALVLGSLRLMGTPMAYLARGRSLAGLYHQTGMYGGIVLGHGLQGYFGFRDPQEPLALLTESLGTLVLFNAGGSLARNLFGHHFSPFERLIEARMAQLEHAGKPRGEASWPWELAWATVGGNRAYTGPDLQINLMATRAVDSFRVVPTSMGIAAGRSAKGEISPREVMRQKLQELLPDGRVAGYQLKEPGFIEQLLESFNIPSHPFDRKIFQQGFDLARRHPERVERMAWDVDEVLLHWSLNPLDLFRGIFRGGREADYQHTKPGTFEYEYFESNPRIRLNPLKRFWFGLVQKVLPT